MLIHAYCNIWCEARNGWRNFVKRRSAVAKINLLPDATQEQLAAYADVCSICYQVFTAANKFMFQVGFTEHPGMKICDALCTSLVRCEVKKVRFFQDMEYAKRTRCGHMFHAICLRKWLYIQDTCPLCHAGKYDYIYQFLIIGWGGCWP